jgi:hypothetical protein
VVDHLAYTGLGADQAFGYLEPGSPFSGPVLLAQPTPGTSNLVAPPPPAPAILGLSLDAAGRATVTWSTVAGRRYRLESQDLLAAPTWEIVGETVAAGPQAWLSDPALSAHLARFYRVILLP